MTKWTKQLGTIISFRPGARLLGLEHGILCMVMASGKKEVFGEGSRQMWIRKTIGRMYY